MFAFLLALGTPQVDPGAMALLKRNRDAMFALRGYRAQCRMVTKNLNPPPGRAPVSHQFAVLTAAKPNLMRYEMWERSGAKPITSRPATPPDFAIVSNGKTQWTQSQKVYFQDKAIDPREFTTALEPWDGFYGPDRTLYEEARLSQQKGEALVVRRVGRERIDGLLCDKIELSMKERRRASSSEVRKVVSLRPDGLVRRQVSTMINDGTVFVTTADLLRIEKNPDLRRQSYAYTPPKGVTLFKAPKAEEATNQGSLLANGKSAPEFVAKDKAGKSIRLSELKGKVVVLDFWASWCAPCLASMPHTQRVADKLRKEGLPVVVLAVDDGEEVEAFRGWTTTKGAEYPALSFVHVAKMGSVSGKLYGVTGIPTQFVIDAKGIIRASFEGYSGETDDLEKAVRAATGR